MPRVKAISTSPPFPISSLPLSLWPSRFLPSPPPSSPLLPSSLPFIQFSSFISSFPCLPLSPFTRFPPFLRSFPSLLYLPLLRPLIPFPSPFPCIPLPPFPRSPPFLPLFHFFSSIAVSPSPSLCLSFPSSAFLFPSFLPFPFPC